MRWILTIFIAISGSALFVESYYLGVASKPRPVAKSCGGGHCGCAAKSCTLPCSTCCHPGTCSMTMDPTARK